MRISVSRTGGFAGIRPPPIVIDTAKLAAAVRKRIEELVVTCGFFDLPASLPDSAKGADQFIHQVSITADDGREHCVSFHAGAASAPLLDLLHLVRGG